MADLLSLLKSRYPVIQGPIGRLNSPEMIAAVCRAGGFGMLALGFVQDMETVKRLVGQVKELTDKPFGANLMIATNPLNEKILDVLARAGVKTVTTSAGNPQKLYPKIHELGIRGLHVVLSLSNAVKASEAHVDGLIVSGCESGGLRSSTPESSNMVLIPLVADKVNLPIVAAGGIADHRGYRAALALGAQGVQIGTRFLAAQESPAIQAWKEAIVNCPDGGTMLLPQGPICTRVIINPKLRKRMSDPQADLSMEYKRSDIGRAWTEGDFDLFPAGGGMVSALIDQVKPVRSIIEGMVKHK